MAINIPSSVFDTYNEAVLLFTRTAKLIYPEKKGSIFGMEIQAHRTL